MTTSELNNQMGRKHTQLESSSSSTPKMLSFLKKIEYLCFAVFLALGIISLVLAKDPRFAIASA
ncbi:MAG: hypothetical protein AAFS12_05855, partial [Cyanobacteria bacterium J06632_19]